MSTKWWGAQLLLFLFLKFLTWFHRFIITTQTFTHKKIKTILYQQWAIKFLRYSDTIQWSKQLVWATSNLQEILLKELLSWVVSISFQSIKGSIRTILKTFMLKHNGTSSLRRQNKNLCKFLQIGSIQLYHQKHRKKTAFGTVLNHLS